jgi:uncharacterized protein (DUF934 family)
MRQLLKDGQVVEDIWTMADENITSLPSSGYLLLSLSQWQQYFSEITERAIEVGVWLEGNEEIPDCIESLLKLPVISIRFSKFVDGRGFSLARLLRERYNYSGELRAMGDIMRDQLYLLKHAGFNAFQLGCESDSDYRLENAVDSLYDFSENYQCTAVQPNPLFRRRFS